MSEEIKGDLIVSNGYNKSMVSGITKRQALYIKDQIFEGEADKYKLTGYYRLDNSFLVKAESTHRHFFDMELAFLPTENETIYYI